MGQLYAAAPAIIAAAPGAAMGALNYSPQVGGNPSPLSDSEASRQRVVKEQEDRINQKINTIFESHKNQKKEQRAEQLELQLDRLNDASTSS
jgi:hypothetical protein